MIPLRYVKISDIAKTLGLNNRTVFNRLKWNGVHPYQGKIRIKEFQDNIESLLLVKPRKQKPRVKPTRKYVIRKTKH